MKNDDAVKLSIDIHDYVLRLSKEGYIAPDNVLTILSTLPFRRADKRSLEEQVRMGVAPTLRIMVNSSAN